MDSNAKKIGVIGLVIGAFAMWLFLTQCGCEKIKKSITGEASHDADKVVQPVTADEATQTTADSSEQKSE